MFIITYIVQIWRGKRDPNSTSGCLPAFGLDLLLGIILIVLFNIAF